MDFEVTPEQHTIRHATRRFAQERLRAGYAERESAGRVDRTLVRKMGALGLIGPELRSRFGGLDAGGVTAGIVIEEVAHTDMNIGYICLLGSLLGILLANHARSEVAEAAWRVGCSRLGHEGAP